MATSTGLVSVQTGSPVVSGNLTSFVAAEGDQFILRGLTVVVAQVVSPSQIVLKQPWSGPTISGASDWDISLTGPYWQSTVVTNKRLSDLLAKFEAGPVKWDAAGLPAERASYNDQPAGFVFLAVGDPWILYAKLANTNSDSDWSPGQAIKGSEAASTAEAKAAAASAQGSASTASSAADTAVGAAGTASSQASSAGGSASAAAGSAGSAAGSAGAAAGSASTALGAASTATSQASTATAAASTATSQAGIASSAASTATTQAGVATTAATNLAGAVTAVNGFDTRLSTETAAREAVARVAPSGPTSGGIAAAVAFGDMAGRLLILFDTAGRLVQHQAGGAAERVMLQAEVQAVATAAAAVVDSKVTTVDGKLTAEVAARSAAMSLAPTGPTSGGIVPATAFGDAAGRLLILHDTAGRLVQHQTNGVAERVMLQSEVQATATAAAAVVDTKVSAEVAARSALASQAPLGPVSNGIVPAVAFGDAAGRQVPILDAAGRLLAVRADGGVEYAATASNVAALAGTSVPMAPLVNGERPVEVTTDPAGRVIRVWTAEGGLHIAGPGGLVKQAKAADIGSSQLSPAYTAQTYDNSLPSVVAVQNNPAVCFILPVLGQSQAVGQNADANDALVAGTPIYPTNAFMLTGGPRMMGQRATGLLPLVEQKTSSAQETYCSAWANHLIRDINAATGIMVKTISFVAAQGGRRYMELKRGTTAYGWFINALTDAVALAKARGWIPIVPAIAWTQGDSDADINRDANMTLERYQRYILQLWRNLNADVKAITGQVEDVVLSISQTGFAYNGYGWSHPVRFAQRVLDGAHGIRVHAPLYPFPMSDNLHQNNAGQNQHGQAIARATLEEVFGVGWRPVVDVAHRWISTTVFEVDFAAPTLPLVLDTSGDVVNVSTLPGLYGFQFDDGSGSPPTLTAAAVQANGRTVRFTLSAAPTGLARRIGYALARSSGSTANGPVMGARGVLRDSSSHASLYGAAAQRNWALAFARDL